VSDYLAGLFGLRDKKAVVIGGTGVLCGRMAEALALAEAEVIVAGRSAERGAARVAEIRANGGSAHFRFVDVSSRESLESLFESAIGLLGGVDILINGAGVNSAVPLFEIADEDWDRVLDTNLKSLHQSCQIFGRYMVARGRGSIINVASVSAAIPLSKVFAYAASKAAVVNYSQNLAREFGPAGVRVNCISPGFFPAEQNRKILDAERTAKVLARTPLERFGEPAELDATILLLASDRGGSFITGANFVVDGGFSAMAI
jgi:NAD(P)-dependent dehydrogenase (short-subunit alcohol dehydrogenase family)